MINEISLSFLNEDDIDQIVSAFKKIGWNKPRNIYEGYLQEQVNNSRSILVAKKNNVFYGYTTIKWQSYYISFKQQSIPEISDLNVLPVYRKQGIGSLLIATCESMAKERGYSHIGLGVGMTADYGNAQRLYVQLGYIQDSRGLFYKNIPVSFGSNVIVDDDLVIYLCKSFDS
jgi:GNAT superfamily N-acetyltransferase